EDCAEGAVPPHCGHGTAGPHRLRCLCVLHVPPAVRRSRGGRPRLDGAARQHRSVPVLVADRRQHARAARRDAGDLLRTAGVTALLCEFARDDGFAGFVRLDVREDVAWYWTYLVGVPRYDGVIVVRDHEVPPPRSGLEVRAEGLWAELWCETPGEH